MKLPEHDPDLEALLEYLKRSRGFDFTGYKRASLIRRIQKRMQAVGIASYTGYVDHLEVHPDEFVNLFNTILINVTGFFRDAPAWESITETILPRLLAEKNPEDPIRVWSAGCASGEEAYTLAMALAEVTGMERFREHVKIYATDVDEDALARARQATYQPREVQGIPRDLLDRYCEPIGGRYVFHKELRRSVIFGRHDLIQDAPISRVDLLVCRNVLMYFNADIQSRILARFHFALNDTGYLFLGKAEMLLTHGGTFHPVDLKGRIFSKVPRVHLRDRLLLMAEAGNEEAVNHLVSHVRIRDAAFDEAPVAQVVVDAAGALAITNERARHMFNLSVRDVGRPFQDLEVSYRPVELRSVIEQAHTERRPIFLPGVKWHTSPGRVTFLDVQATPLIDNTGAVTGISITFDDVTGFMNLQAELTSSHEELETAYEELQSTNEELETTNEELQSTIEELETTNEELQSTNEELETMNEELQATNEELQTINEELRRRGEDLNQANAFLAAILASLRGGVAVVDRDLQIQAWNDRAEDLWEVRATEVLGRHFLNLDIGLPVEQLQGSLRACLSGQSSHEEVMVAATNRRGRTIQCKVTCTPLVSPNGDGRGAIVLMDELLDAREA